MNYAFLTFAVCSGMAALYQHCDQCHGGGGSCGCCHCHCHHRCCRHHHHHYHPHSSAAALHPPTLFSCYPGHVLPCFLPPLTPCSC